MKKIFLFFLVSLVVISSVLAAQGETQNQVKVQSGMYENSDGEQMQIQTEDKFRLEVEGVEAESVMEVNQEQDQVQNKTKLKVHLSNGRNAEIKIMPNTASQRAIERLQLKVCSSENDCTIELKEVGNGEQAKVAYEIKAQKEARVFGMFKTKMQVQAQIDAETEEVIQAKKPWWAFAAVE
jgi:predicted DNA-binding antitoxin AbrB/MazE fold protein